MRSVFIISKNKFHFRAPGRALTGQSVSSPVTYDVDTVLQLVAKDHQISNRLDDENEQFFAFETLEAAEEFAERLALDLYQINDTKDPDFRKAAYIVETRKRIRKGEVIDRDALQQYTKDLATDSNYLSGKCERLLSHAVAEVKILDNKEESPEQIAKKDILFLNSVALRDGNHNRVIYPANYRKISFANLYKKENPCQSYIAMLEKYNKGPCWGIFRNHETDALKLMLVIQKYFQIEKRLENIREDMHIYNDIPTSFKSLIELFRDELKKDGVKQTGHYAQCLRDMMKLEIDRKNELEAIKKYNYELGLRCTL